VKTEHDRRPPHRSWQVLLPLVLLTLTRMRSRSVRALAAHGG
jgi:hypothetical protein